MTMKDKQEAWKRWYEEMMNDSRSRNIAYRKKYKRCYRRLA